MLTGEIKKRCAEELQKYVLGFQERRAKVTDEIVAEFMKVRPLKLKWDTAGLGAETNEGADAEAGGDGKMTKNQLKKLEKARQQAEKKEKKQAEKAAAAAPADAQTAKEEAS